MGVGRSAATVAVVFTAFATLTSASGVVAQVRLSQQRALRIAFPEPAVIERRSAFLNDDDLERARQLAGPDVEVEQRVVTYYVGVSDGQPLGVAYFDAHRVRTLPEVLMFVVTPDKRISDIEVLKFSEPPEYRAPEGWLAQFDNRPLSDDLSLKGEIVTMSGATLTSRAVTRAARRILALHDIVRPFAPDKGSR